MNKSNFTRREFLKLTLAGLGAALLAACERLVKPVTLPDAGTAPTATGTPEPTATATATPTPTETATPTEIPCFKLLTPEDGAKLNPVGRVTFSWEPMPGAASYRLEITLPTGQVVSFDTTGLSRGQYLEAIKVGGQFQWRVAALDSTGAVICSAGPFTFEKPEAGDGKKKPGDGDDTSSFATISHISIA